ncbi:hypothetical protein PsorP6_013864 [Peronosclerospora sorghi]|uniref:Uncharacterized protein n=1 Tax=Peronosclerospora sorghi TaxID=230839 RepID=A0ACC0VFP2_9STRA|nr:hypothetical protein PsorP6_013864 [Peronosclerospora sorghi]
MTQGKEATVCATASQVPDDIADLYAWEKTIAIEDAARKQAAKPLVAVTTPPRTAQKVKTHDAHTYTKGYKRWETSDVDPALREGDDERVSEQKRRNIGRSGDAFPSPRPVDNMSKGEGMEKEQGNAHYKRGDYVAAIESYTRCLDSNPNNVVVLSNRAMAYLKNQEFAKAEDDCTVALKADPLHIKSLLRRGTARNALGKHRLALLDFYRAATLDPKHRQHVQSTREIIRSAIKRSPKRTEFSIEVVDKSSTSKHSGVADTDTSGLHPLESSRSGTKEKGSPLDESAIASVPQNTVSLETTLEQSTTTSFPMLPKLPKKAPTTSYEFERVWKTFALRGDADQRNHLLKLRAEYLHMIDPRALCRVFKNAIESDVLCEIFHVFRHAVLSSSEVNCSPSIDSVSFVLAFVREMTKVPRFGMTVMLLSESEKQDMAWVIEQLEALLKENNQFQDSIGADLKKLYELQTNDKLIH